MWGMMGNDREMERMARGDDKGIGKLNVKGCMEFVFGVIRGAKEQQRFQNEYQGTS